MRGKIEYDAEVNAQIRKRLGMNEEGTKPKNPQNPLMLCPMEAVRFEVDWAKGNYGR